ncbi:MAG: dihydroorotase [Verrucomicrobiota bacterium]
MNSRLLRNGTLPGAECASLLIDQAGKIERLGDGLIVPDQVEEIDCEGKLILPGMFDMHVHACDPGNEHRETLASARAAAQRGGITGMLMMPDTSPAIDSGAMVDRVQERVAALGEMPMLSAGCLTLGGAGEKLSGIARLARSGVRVLTDAGMSTPPPDVLRTAMHYARDYDLTVAIQGDTPSLTRHGAMNEGAMSYRLGLPGSPAVAEEMGIDQAIRLAQDTKVRLHIHQLSTALGVEMVRRAKADGFSVTAEVSVCHLLFDESAVGSYDTRFKLRPPLRLESDRLALLAGVIDGTIDVIVSGHSPATLFEKSAEFALAPTGVSGLETSLLALFDRLILTGDLSWEILIERFSTAPREILGIEVPKFESGRRDDFLIFDPGGESKIDPAKLASKGPTTPFAGEILKGQIVRI